MTGDNGDPVNFLDLVRHIRESAIVVWNEMDVNKNGYIDYKGNLLKGIGSLSSVRFKSISRIINHVTCYEFDTSHWLKLQHSDWKEYFNQ